MSSHFPDQEGEAAREGTASHWSASEILAGRPAPQPGQKCPENGVILTAEMIESAKVYVDVARQYIMTADIHVEKRVAINRIHPDCFGTTDLWFFNPCTPCELHVFDYKYGFGIVEPFENTQLICYAVGILDQLASAYHQGPGWFDQHVSVHLHIVQPRPFHVLGPHRVWSLPHGALLRGHANRLANAAEEAMSANPTVTSGNWCRYCRARHACSAAQKAAMFAVDYSCNAQPENLSVDGLAIELRTLQRAAEAIKFRLTGLEAAATAIIEGGGTVPGFCLQSGQGRRNWTVPAEQVFAMGDMLGVNLRAEPSAITPKQAKDKGLNDSVIKSMTEIPSNGIKLVPSSQTIASMVFKQQPVRR